MAAEQKERPRQMAVRAGAREVSTNEPRGGVL